MGDLTVLQQAIMERQRIEYRYGQLLRERPDLMEALVTELKSFRRKLDKMYKSEVK